MSAFEIQNLEDQIKAANIAYGSGSPFMTDDEYNKLWRQLFNLDSDNPNLYHTSRDPNLASDQRPHKFPLYAPQRVFKTDELRIFLTRFKDEQLIAEPKYDGVAAVLYRQPRGVHSLILSGDGTAGRDISHHLPNLYLDFHPQSAESVELVIPWVFWQDSFGANPRNVAAGWLARSEIPLRNVMHIVSHDKGKQRERLQPWRDYEELDHQLLALYHKWSNLYPIDGIMIKPEREEARLKAGHGANTLNWSIAWKPPIQTAKTKISAVEWHVSRTGRIIPKIRYHAVKLCGTMNDSVTGNNAEWFANRKLSPEGKITIGKAGEIIPQIIDVDPANLPSKLPSQCPYCYSALFWRGKDLICFSPDCLPKQTKRIAHFYSKKGMDLKSIGEQMIWQLLEDAEVRQLLVERPWLLLDPPDELHRAIIFHWGEKRTARYLSNRDEISGKRNSLHFIAGLGMPGLAYRSALKIYHEILMGKVTTNVSNKAYNSFLEAIYKFNAVCDEIANFEFTAIPQPAKLTYCITGTLCTCPREDMIDYLAQFNWQAVNQVSKSTDLLILGELPRPSTKQNKATEYGIKIINEQELLQRIAEETSKRGGQNESESENKKSHGT